MTIRRELLAAKQTLMGADTAHLDPTPPRQGIRAAGNSTEWAASVLRAAQQPMHVNEIISAIEREFQVSVRYATLVGNIARLVKKHKVFERTGPNRFGLLEWQTQREAEELFGREEYEREHGPDA